MTEEVVQRFINFVVELVDDEFDYYIDFISAKNYFLNGGCLEFALVIKHFIPSAKLVINKSRNHIAVEIDDNVYDCTGLINKEEFNEVTNEDSDYISEFIGIKEIKFDGKRVNNAVIQELYDCTGTYVMDTVKKINKINNKKRLQ